MKLLAFHVSKSLQCCFVFNTKTHILKNIGVRENMFFGMQKMLPKFDLVFPK